MLEMNCLSWAALPVAQNVLFCAFDTHNPKISSNTRSPLTLKRKGSIFKPEGFKAHFSIILIFNSWSNDAL